jgi:carboxymethylenebutenolidase
VRAFLSVLARLSSIFLKPIPRPVNFCRGGHASPLGLCLAYLIDVAEYLTHALSGTEFPIRDLHRESHGWNNVSQKNYTKGGKFTMRLGTPRISEHCREQEHSNPEQILTSRQELLRDVWEEHVRYEFETGNTEDTLDTMVEDAYVNHMPVLTGGVGRDELREFYSKRFIPQMPEDTEMIAISRTIGSDQVVDEMVFKFTHTKRMDWMLPGIDPTGKQVEVPLVAIVRFREGKLAHEHIYWDQASVLVQLGLLDAGTLPAVGVETARKALDPSLPSNALIKRADRRG